MQPDNKWERRQQFRQIDAWLEREYREHRVRFNLIGFAAAVVLCALAYGLMELLHWIAGLI